jgi:hypothetical protein
LIGIKLPIRIKPRLPARSVEHGQQVPIFFTPTGLLRLFVRCRIMPMDDMADDRIMQLHALSLSGYHG